MTICKATNCKKCALYNIIEEKPKYCKIHKDDNMINVGSKKCEICKIKTPSFGLEDQKTPTHCSDCMEDNMVDLKHFKCIKCQKERASFGFPEDSKTHCINCKENGMISNNKICIKCKIKTAGFGFENNNYTHCGDCIEDGMYNTKEKKCEICNIKNAYFGLKNEKITHCSDCKTIDMDNLKDKKCIVCKIKLPSFGLKNGTKTHCFDCKTKDMIDVKHKKCKTNFCDSSISNFAYNGYCAYCFGNLFPNDPKVCNYKTKERLLADFIKEEFNEYEWKFDKIIYGGISRRRPDIFLELDKQIIIIENDEYQHKFHDTICINKRTMELSQDVNYKPIIFIRFNPDCYIDENNKRINSCFSITRQTGKIKINNNKKWNERLDTLKKTVKYWIDNNTTKTIEDIKLYYDKI
jgi:hypothetical protein